MLKCLAVHSPQIAGALHVGWLRYRGAYMRCARLHHDRNILQRAIERYPQPRIRETPPFRYALPRAPIHLFLNHLGENGDMIGHEAGA